MRSRFRQYATAGLLAQAAIAASTAAFAAVPAGLTEQGRLFDGNGNPLNAVVGLQLSIYTVASGGTAVCTEQQTVTLDQGYFSVELGAGTPIPQAVWDG